MKQNNESNKDERLGFTLIEMLFAVAIVAILATILVVSIRSALLDSKEKSVLREMHTLQTRSILYHIDNNSYGVASLQVSCDSGLFADPEFMRITASIQNKSEGVMLCAIGKKGDTFAVEINSPQLGYLCVDTFNLKKTQMNWIDVNSAVRCLE